MGLDRVFLDSMSRKCRATRSSIRTRCSRAAVEAFWRNGYEKTSLDDRITGTNVGRDNQYPTFGDKRPLNRSARPDSRDETQGNDAPPVRVRPSAARARAAILNGISQESRADHERGARAEREPGTPSSTTPISRRWSNRIRSKWKQSSKRRSTGLN